MAAVYKARDLATHQLVALKVIAAGDREASMRMAREARLLSRVRHPNVVSYVDSGACQGLVYVAMEWVDGITLQKYLKRRKKLGVGETLALLYRLASGLAALHAQGFVHRDIKPSNIMVGGDDAGAIKLIDLGIAKRSNTTAQTNAGTLLGTPAYMSPEQARGEAVDVRSDVWGLGVLLFRCLTGRLPFRASDGVSTLEKVAIAEPPEVRNYLIHVSLDVELLLSRLLTRRRSDRFIDAGAAAEAFAKLARRAGAVDLQPESGVRQIGVQHRPNADCLTPVPAGW